MITPLPYPDADRIVRVAAAAMPRTGLAEFPFSVAGYLHIANNQTSFEAFGGYLGTGRQWRVPLVDDGPPQEVRRVWLQLSALEVLGVGPELGRLPVSEQSGSQVVLISHGLWVGRYGADRSIIGRTITMSSSAVRGRRCHARRLRLSVAPGHRRRWRSGRSEEQS